MTRLVNGRAGLDKVEITRFVSEDNRIELTAAPAAVFNFLEMTTRK